MHERSGDANMNFPRFEFLGIELRRMVQRSVKPSVAVEERQPVT
jgi:hypothetical protein